MSIDSGELPSVGHEQYDLLKLDRQLCFALYAASRALTKTYRERLSDLKLTYPQYLVLLVLWENDGIPVSGLGRHLLLDTGTLTPLLKRLETMELIRRVRSTGDERQVHIHLAPAGMALKPEVLEARKHVASRIGMSEDEIVELRQDLMQIINRLDAN